MNKIVRIFKDPFYAVWKLLVKTSPHIKSDRMYIMLDTFLMTRRFPKLDNPKTYNDKVNWLKLNFKQPEYTEWVDKYKAKILAEKIIGKDHIIPTLGVWDSFDDIDFNSLPRQFVLKTTHDSGGVVICEDKLKFNIDAARKKINSSLNRNWYYIHREYPYKTCERKIIAEQFLTDGSIHGLVDYKFFCFNGVPKMVYVGSARMGKQQLDHFDMDFNLLPFERHFKHADVTPKKPASFESMKALAKKLSRGFLHVRVDLYDINGHLYFGELTFFPGAGIRPFNPKDWDYKVGEWLELPSSNQGG